MGQFNFYKNVCSMPCIRLQKHARCPCRMDESDEDMQDRLARRTFEEMCNKIQMEISEIINKLDECTAKY